MHMLYDSDAFAVVHILANAPAEGDTEAADGPQIPRHGFEIVDTRSGKEVDLGRDVPVADDSVATEHAVSGRGGGHPRGLCHAGADAGGDALTSKSPRSPAPPGFFMSACDASELSIHA